MIKGVMRDLRCGRSRAKELLAGYAPTTFHLEEMVELWGDDFLRAIFVEAWERQDERIRVIQQREEEMRQRAEEAEAIAAAYKRGDKFSFTLPLHVQAIQALELELATRQPPTLGQRLGRWLRRFGLEA
ncbi:hypothetical protein J2848_005665 [Azospirillum lipoferum]|uniref:Uncharacterized protein n=1 Tax=Azospirillum lipoferum TaxID=193 RepID=A0A5A9GF75_AZOLI|nr:MULTISPECIES: hypothetical protein [Azospirillum]KAA0592977.1 hypothetical protein FZ942_25985 [Azospirillum lipoferum]MCP1613964.1 hypothetical protein [Azospirillum lipoferum]MDW5537643.1 hypothetical protein [Azospirillum sp. NL1]